MTCALDVRSQGRRTPPTLDNALPPVNLGWDRIAIRSYSSTTGLSYWPHQRANVADSASGKDRRDRPVGTPKQGAPTHRCHARKRGNCRIDSNREKQQHRFQPIPQTGGRARVGCGGAPAAGEYTLAGEELPAGRRGRSLLRRQTEKHCSVGSPE